MFLLGNGDSSEMDFTNATLHPTYFCIIQFIHQCVDSRSEIFEALDPETATEEAVGPPFGPSLPADLGKLLKDFKEKELTEKQANEVSAGTHFKIFIIRMQQPVLLVLVRFTIKST